MLLRTRRMLSAKLRRASAERRPNDSNDSAVDADVGAILWQTDSRQSRTYSMQSSTYLSAHNNGVRIRANTSLIPSTSRHVSPHCAQASGRARAYNTAQKRCLGFIFRFHVPSLLSLDAMPVKNIAHITPDRRHLDRLVHGKRYAELLLNCRHRTALRRQLPWRQPNVVIDYMMAFIFLFVIRQLRRLPEAKLPGAPLAR